jgi:hypothetical protein
MILALFVWTASDVVGLAFSAIVLILAALWVIWYLFCSAWDALQRWRTGGKS